MMDKKQRFEFSALGDRRRPRVIALCPSDLLPFPVDFRLIHPGAVHSTISSLNPPSNIRPHPQQVVIRPGMLQQRLAGIGRVHVVLAQIVDATRVGVPRPSASEPATPLRDAGGLDAVLAPPRKRA
ncbi:hypothetical protein [Burkholderia sp. BCC0322]|uniref:hypothetical protein n=1 Tax=Burkholderia sp. BCC0322 TaxID=2676296 RepID=UPI001FC80505|nr:hypothetical protein [Burkholderia sp. BCC0322]